MCLAIDDGYNAMVLKGEACFPQILLVLLSFQALT